MSPKSSNLRKNTWHFGTQMFLTHGFLFFFKSESVVDVFLVEKMVKMLLDRKNETIFRDKKKRRGYEKKHDLFKVPSFFSILFIEKKTTLFCLDFSKSVFWSKIYSILFDGKSWSHIMILKIKNHTKKAVCCSIGTSEFWNTFFFVEIRGFGVTCYV